MEQIEKEFDIFRYPKLLEMLKFLYLNEPKRIVDISKGVNIQHSYICRQTKTLKELRLIETKKDGRNILVSLTNKGKEIGRRVYEIQKKVK